MKSGRILFSAIATLAGLLSDAYSQSLVHFEVTGAKPGIYRASQEDGWLSVINTNTQFIVWRCELGESTHGHDILFSAGPDGQNALLIHQYGVRSQSLYWIGLAGHSAGFVEISEEPLRKIVAGAIDVAPEQLSDLSYEIKKWHTDRTCILIWDCRVGGVDESSYNAGSVLVTKEDGKTPLLNPFSSRLRMSFQQWRKLGAAAYEPLLAR